MPAYLLATLDVHDPEAYVERYVPGANATVAAHGGVILAAGGRVQAVEGDVFDPRLVIVAFEDRGAARRWYDSPEYQQVVPERLATATGSMISIDGTDEPYRPGWSYALATMTVVDQAVYGSYGPPAIASVADAGGKVLVRGGEFDTLEGEAFGPRNVLLTFPTYDAALGWYQSAEYQQLAPMRQDATKDNGFVIVEGFPA
jgi:uncharacterized protein (DUF1330 family)